MTITIDLPSEVEAKIRTQASNENMRVEDYIILLLREELGIREESNQKKSAKKFHND